ncbi:DJ-1/PfpI family protein [Oceanobacillus halotolerans]|uniref:DJ-1/PfpI family protein n=1 Tax=Oceanobacillus halotolerans TaxID=2663380 RepID=UPI001CF76A70|nr:DJ-1/PfpI family protein [Oceanobacillus halotolerans]
MQAFYFQLGKLKSQSVRQQVVDMFGSVDEGLATAIAEYVGVNHPSSVQVSVTSNSPALSQVNSPKYPYSLKVGVLVGNGFNGKEVKHTSDMLQEYGVFIDFIGEKFGTVTGTDGTKINVNNTFLTTNPTLYDSLYVAGGSSENEAKFNQDIKNFIGIAYKHYKPIGVAATAQTYIQASEENNLAGVVFAANNPNFSEEFVKAIAQQRFWNRT